MALEFHVSDVDELIGLLKAGGLSSVTRDRKMLLLPGVLVRIAGLRPATLQALEVQLTLQLVGRDTDDDVTWSDLEDLHNKTTTALDELGIQFGEVTGNLITLPSAPTKPMSALALPVSLLTTQE